MAEAFLLDTSILSELAPGRRPLPPRVASWMAAREARFHIATITIAEISEGIAQLRRAGATGRAEAFRAWLAEILERYDHRLLPLDAGAALIAGELADAATAAGRHPGLADVVIAATARHNGLTVLTRNLRHFGPLDVPCLDPFAAGA